MIRQLRIILKPIIVINMLLAFFMILSGIYGIFLGEKESYTAFFKTTLLIMGLSFVLVLFSEKREKTTITIRSGFVLVVLIWIFTCFLGALPYYISGAIPSMVDCLYESVSGFTTAGSSILADIEGLPYSIQLWRALTHWIGGGGIVVLSVAILPLLGIGSTQLMQAEASGVTKEKLTPRITQTAKYIWLLYISLNIIGIILLSFGGMNLLDAFTHASSAIATGGFSNKNTSVAYFSSAYIDWVLIVFMYIGSLNFLLLIKFAKGEVATFFKDTELKVFTGIILVIAFIISLVLYFQGGEYYQNMDGKYYNSYMDALRFSMFQVVSVISTTGFATADFNLWSSPAQVLIFLLFFIGGCAGSSSGGVKVIRHVIMFKQAVINIKSLIHPKGVYTMRISRSTIPDKAIVSVLGFVILYLLIVFVASFIVAFSGLTPFESFSAVLGNLGTIGPGFGVVGPASNYGSLPDFAKITLFITMIIGRLEIFTVLILFSPWFWKK